MITELPESNAPCLGFEISGKVTLEEEQQWVQRLELALDAHPKLNLLVVLDEGASWGLKAGVEDIKWITKHAKRFDKIAFVSSSKVLKWLISVDGFFAQFVGIQEKHFEHENILNAWAWIKG